MNHSLQYFARSLSSIACRLFFCAFTLIGLSHALYAEGGEAPQSSSAQEPSDSRALKLKAWEEDEARKVFGLGSSFMSQGNTALAIREFSEILEFFPDTSVWPQTCLQLSKLHLYNENFKASENVLERLQQTLSAQSAPSLKVLFAHWEHHLHASKGKKCPEWIQSLSEASKKALRQHPDFIRHFIDFLGHPEVPFELALKTWMALKHPKPISSLLQLPSQSENFSFSRLHIQRLLPITLKQGDIQNASKVLNIMGNNGWAQDLSTALKKLQDSHEESLKFKTAAVSTKEASQDPTGSPSNSAESISRQPNSAESVSRQPNSAESISRQPSSPEEAPKLPQTSFIDTSIDSETKESNSQEDDEDGLESYIHSRPTSIVNLIVRFFLQNQLFEDANTIIRISQEQYFAKQPQGSRDQRPFVAEEIEAAIGLQDWTRVVELVQNQIKWIFSSLPYLTSLKLFQGLNAQTHFQLTAEELLKQVSPKLQNMLRTELMSDPKEKEQRLSQIIDTDTLFAPRATALLKQLYLTQRDVGQLRALLAKTQTTHPQETAMAADIQKAIHTLESLKQSPDEPEAKPQGTK